MKGQGQRGIFFVGKGHPMRKLNIPTRSFQGHLGNDQGVMEAIALVAFLEVSGLQTFLDDGGKY